MEKNKKIIFPIGSKVVVKSEYRENEINRKEVGTVISHDTYLNTDLVDNLVQFPDGIKESFGNWELVLA